MARLFVERADKAEAAALGNAVASAEVAARDGDSAAYVEAFAAFYAVLLAGSGNDVARRILETLDARISYLRHITTERAPARRQAQTVRLLRGIFTSIAAHRSDVAARRCEAFVMRSARFALDVLCNSS
jgi:DNA-binding GntR family transcriptional regulator